MEMLPGVQRSRRRVPTTPPSQKIQELCQETDIVEGKGRWHTTRNMKSFIGWRIEPGSIECPLVIAHRGASGMAPENTVAAFQKAVEVGADAVELDVRLTKDGQVVVIHDRRLERTTAGMGNVGCCTLGELKSLEAGSWFDQGFRGESIPTLEEVFDALPDDFLIYVEIKARGLGARALASKVVGLVGRYGRWESTMVASFNPLAMAYIRMVEPRIIRGYIWSSQHPLPLRARWLSPLVNPHWLAPDRRTLTEVVLARAHAAGRPVAAWDMDASADMGRLKEMGLDAAVTDHPEVLVRQRTALIEQI